MSEARGEGNTDAMTSVDAEAMREALRLAQGALEAVEWQPIHAGHVILGYGCLWCVGDRESGHHANCARQRALSAIREVLT